MQERIFGFFGEKNKNIVSKDINDTDTGKQSVYETVNFNVTKYKSNGVSHALVILNANSIQPVSIYLLPHRNSID